MTQIKEEQIKEEYQEPKFLPGNSEASSSTSAASTTPAEASQFGPVGNDASVPPETSVEAGQAHDGLHTLADTFNNNLNISTNNEPPHAHFGYIPWSASGINGRGALWCSHEHGTSYHYVNPDGSIYFYNPDHSSYFWDPVGAFSRYVDPNGIEYINRDPRPEDEIDSFCFRCKSMDY